MLNLESLCELIAELKFLIDVFLNAVSNTTGVYIINIDKCVQL